MAFDPSDAITARALLERALAMDTKPSLAVSDVDLLMTIAGGLDTDGVTVVYPAAGLNQAAAQGWTWKAGLTADQYDIGGQGGAKLTRDQWHQHCRQMAADYGSGAISVTGTSTRRSGIGTIGLITTTSKPYWDTQP